MKKIVLAVSLLFTLLFLVGCTATVSRIPGTRPTWLDMRLERADYSILATATGEASGERILLFPVGLKRYFGSASGWSIATFGDGTIISTVKSNAIYEALKKVPDADFMIEPRYEMSVEDYLFYAKVTIKVSGKAIKLKSDSELK
jgi:hypothetical protein